MLIIVNSNGTITKILPDRVKQGSNEANNIYCVGNIVSNAQMYISFKLGDGTTTEPYLMTPSANNVDSTSNAWVISVQDLLTQYYGKVKLQLNIVINGKTITSGESSFLVEKGVPPILPAIPTADIYGQILDYLSTIEGNMENGYYSSVGIKQWVSTYSYQENDVVCVVSAGAIKFYVSLVADNLNNAVNDTEYWTELQ